MSMPIIAITIINSISENPRWFFLVLLRGFISSLLRLLHVALRFQFPISATLAQPSYALSLADGLPIANCQLPILRMIEVPKSSKLAIGNATGAANFSVLRVLLACRMQAIHAEPRNNQQWTDHQRKRARAD